MLTISSEKFALALKCLVAAHGIDSSDPTLHVQLVRFRLALNNLSETIPETISDIVTKEFETVLAKSTDLGEWNKSFLATHKNSADHVRAALYTRMLMNPDSKPECEKEFISTLDLENVTLEKAISGLEVLDEWNSSVTTKEAYKNKAHDKFKRSSVFVTKQA